MKKIGNGIGVFLLISMLLAGLTPFSEPLPAFALGAIRHASPSGVNTGTCGTWGSACNLQRAIAVAVSGNQIWVKQGLYLPTSTTNRGVSFPLKVGVKIYGGFAGNETLLSQRNPITHITILSGNIGSPGTASDNSYHVVSAAGTNPSTVLDGFTITGGNANGSGFDILGGGMFDFSGTPTLNNVIFKYNFAAVGGGLYNNNNPTLTNVTFQNNKSTNLGGGMYNDGGSPSLTNVIFIGNSAVKGGAIYNFFSGAVLTNATFNSNKATGSGGGIYDEGSNPTLKDVTFNSNSANFGGAMYNTSSSSPTLTDVTFNANKAADSGGGMDNDTSGPILTNVTLSANTASNFGGGMFDNSSFEALTNVTFNGNTAPSGGGAIASAGGSADINDSIFWNDSSEIYLFISSATIEDSLIAGGCPSGATCSGALLTTDPKLGPLANNGGLTKTMALKGGSSAIDAGNNSTCASKDQRDVVRPQGPHCDMGAYEVRVKTFTSVAAYDGWVLESAKGSNLGGSTNSSGNSFNVGDDSSNRRYRGVLSFNTASLPDGAAVVKAQVRVKPQQYIGDPIDALGPLLADVDKPYFGSSLGLVNSDWQAAATVSSAGSFLTDGSSFWTLLNNSARTKINKTGTTQVRMRFSSDPYNNAADYAVFYSGSASPASNRPSLSVYYNP